MAEAINNNDLPEKQQATSVLAASDTTPSVSTTSDTTLSVPLTLDTTSALAEATPSALPPVSNTPQSEESPEPELTAGRKNLRQWLGKAFRVVITDGRVLVGFFNCTDKDANVVLSMCAEYLEEGKDARILGNVMIPGKHIVSISVDMQKEEPV